MWRDVVHVGSRLPAGLPFASAIACWLLLQIPRANRAPSWCAIETTDIDVRPIAFGPAMLRTAAARDDGAAARMDAVSHSLACSCSAGRRLREFISTEY